MLKTRIIPCLDVKDGRVVKGTNFINLRDAGDPVEIAKIYNDEGADELCFLDISASQENRNTTYDIVKNTAEKCFMPLTVGGGVRQVSEVETLLNHGADKVSFNSAAVSNPKLISLAADKFGSQCIVVAIDAKYSVSINDWEVFTHGGTKSTGIKATEFAKTMEDNGAGEILLTSMDKDLTVIIIAHRISTVTNCDCIYEFKNGKVAAFGKYDELLIKSESFREIVKNDSTYF